MFLAAVAHIYSFPHSPFHINSPQYWNNPNRSWCRALLSVMDVSDMQEDVSEHLGVLTGSISRRFQGRSTYQPVSRGLSQNEAEYLINKRSNEAPGSPTGNRQNTMFKHVKLHQKRTTSNNNNKQANVKRYGATDSHYVLPVNEHANILEHPTSSHINNHSYIEYPTTSKNVARIEQKSKYYSPGISGKDTIQRQQKMNQDHIQLEPTLHVPSNTTTTTTSGISIQRQDSAQSFAPHFGAPLTEHNFLQGRGLVDEDDEDLATLLGNHDR